MESKIWITERSKNLHINERKRSKKQLYSDIPPFQPNVHNIKGNKKQRPYFRNTEMAYFVVEYNYLCGVNSTIGVSLK